MNQIQHYIDRNGKNHYATWRKGLRDNKACIAIDRRITRMALGNFGNYKHLRDGVWELRLDIGPGYRVYYAKTGSTVVLLLCGGTKRKQDADIEKACKYWKDWQQREGD